jgi:glucose/arabinose dehydrogenase
MKAVWLAAVSTVALASSAFAQPAAQPPTSNLEKLSSFQGTGTVEPKPIPQEGRRADSIRRNLEKIKLPKGFKIDLYAIVPDARHMAVGPSTGVLFVGTRKNTVYVVTDRDKDRVADEVKQFAPSVEFKIPNGVCFSRDGVLYVAEQNRVLQFPAAEFFYEGPDVAAFVVAKQGDLIPPTEESYNHTARVCRIGPDNKLYIALGQPFNVPPKDKMDLYKRAGIGGIIRMDQDGKNREVYATGIRNSVGMDFNPADKTL